MMNTTIDRQLKTVKYPRRHWLFTYPAGTDSHRRAVLAGLEADMPEVVDEVRVILYSTKRMEQAEEIATRAIKAAFIIQDRKVWPPRDPHRDASYINEIARVQGSRNEAYVISFDGQECHCDCHDFQLSNAPILPTGQRACKHILAVLITEAIKEDEVKF